MKKNILHISDSNDFFQDVFAEKLNIKSSSITLDKQTQITVFKKMLLRLTKKIIF